MAENSKLNTILIVGAVGIGAYFLFKDKIKNYFEGVSERFDNSLDIAQDTILETSPIPMVKTINTIYEVGTGENFAGIPRLQAAQNVAVALKEGTKGKVKDITGGTGTYKAHSGTLQVKDLGFSVSAQNAPAMAAQIMVANKVADAKATASTYSKINTNPYSQFK